MRHKVEDDVYDGGNAHMGVVYKGEGRQLGGRAMHSFVVGGATGGGRRGGGHGNGFATVKLQLS